MKRIVLLLYIFIYMILMGIDYPLGIEDTGKEGVIQIEDYVEIVAGLQPGLEEVYLMGFSMDETEDLRRTFARVDFISYGEDEARESGRNRALIVKGQREKGDLLGLDYPVYGYGYEPTDEFTMVLSPWDGQKMFFNYPETKRYSLNYYLLEGGYSFYNMDGHFFVIDKRNLNRIIISFHLTVIVSIVMFYLIISRRKLMKELIETRARAEEASLEKGRFLAHMSHEIRTPLSGIIGTVEILRGIHLERQIRERIEVIGGASRHLLEIINDILDFSKIEANKMEINRVDFDLRETLEEVLRIFESGVNKKGLRLLCRCSAEVSHTVTGDRLALRKILINLVGNAVKFTSEGEVVLEVEGGKDRLVFSVRDTGIGISSEVLKRISQEFIQGQQGNSREYEGTGLGLAISSRLLQLMGTELHMESKPGEGSTFSFELDLPGVGKEIPRDSRGFILYTSLPDMRDIFREFGEEYGLPYIMVGDREELLDMTEDEEVAEDYPHTFIGEDVWDPACPGDYTVVAMSPRDIGEVPVISLNPLFNWRIKRSMEGMMRSKKAGIKREVKALIVDDSRLNLEVLRGLLEEAGIEVASAMRGTQALDLLTDETDIVFTDIQMPEMDGYEVARRVKVRRSEIPVVAVTANAFVEDREEALRGSMDAYVTKPFHREDLIEVIEDLIPGMKAEKLLRKNGEEGLLRDCLEEIPQGISGLEKALYERSVEKVRYYAHKLKGEFSYLMEERIGFLLGEIEAEPEEFQKNTDYLEIISGRWKSLKEKIGEIL